MDAELCRTMKYAKKGYVSIVLCLENVGMSDVSASTMTGQPSTVSKPMTATILSLHRRATQLRHDVDSLRQLHVSSVEFLMSTLTDVFHKLQVSIFLLSIIG